MATIPVPHTWIAGDDATSTVMQTLTDTGLWNLGSATSGGSKKPLAVLRQTVAQSIATGAFAALTFDTEDADYDNGHSTVTNPTRYTGASPGWHLVKGVYGTASSASGRRLVGIRKNGTGAGNPTDARADAAAAASVQVFMCIGLVFLNGTTDYVETVCLQDSGGALLTNVAGTDGQPRMEVWWVSN